MLTCSPESFNCSQCSYTTKRKYNYVRHIRTVHNIQELVDLQNVDVFYKNVDDDSKNVDVDPQNVDVFYKNVDVQLNKCSKCNKCLSTKYYLKKHMENCNNKDNPLLAITKKTKTNQTREKIMNSLNERFAINRTENNIWFGKNSSTNKFYNP